MLKKVREEGLKIVEGGLRTVKQIKVESWDAIRFSEDGHDIALVKGGKRAYIWIGSRHAPGANSIYTFCGPKPLRKLAKAILKEIPE